MRNKNKFFHLELILSNEPDANVISPKKLSPIDRLRRTLSIRNRKKENTGPSSIKNGTKAKKPLQWQEDEKSVRVGTCSFNVKVKIFFVRIFYRK